MSGRYSADSLALRMSRRIFSILLTTLLSKFGSMRASSPPNSFRSSSITAIALSSLSTSSSMFNTISSSVSKAAASCSFATRSTTSAFLKLSGVGSASKSALMSSSKSRISCSVSVSISSAVSSWLFSFNFLISSLFSSRKLCRASMARSFLAIAMSEEVFSLASRFALRRSTSNAFTAFVLWFWFEETTSYTLLVSYAVSIRIRSTARRSKGVKSR
mmetsp:Transcript_27876/g.61408  ORF Transcript_27876/g.61408 Transcript_27876/m.61408 type:complete len:217 (+) Transcript_27876:1952-2602(+)